MRGTWFVRNNGLRTEQYFAWVCVRNNSLCEEGHSLICKSHSFTPPPHPPIFLSLRPSLSPPPPSFPPSLPSFLPSFLPPSLLPPSLSPSPLPLHPFLPLSLRLYLTHTDDACDSDGNISVQVPAAPLHRPQYCSNRVGVVWSLSVSLSLRACVRAVRMCICGNQLTLSFNVSGNTYVQENPTPHFAHT